MRFLICSMLRASALTALLAAPSFADDETGFESLFDGKSLAGWEGDQSVFRVQEGAIVGGSLDKPVPHNDFLASKQDYGDFELRLKFKVLGKGVNAGIQFRSRRIPNHYEVKGYQADLGDGYWGSIYDESRRNRVVAAAKPEIGEKVIKKDDWNDYRIRCEGKHIQLWINGEPTVDYTEPEADIEQTGIIALQIHGGGPSEAWYRDIRLKKL